VDHIGGFGIVFFSGFVGFIGLIPNCIYRYNVSINDGTRVKGQKGATQDRKIIWFSDFMGFNGQPKVEATNNHVYNNTIYAGARITTQIRFESNTNNNTVKNNIIYVEGTLNYNNLGICNTPFWK